MASEPSTARAPSAAAHDGGSILETEEVTKHFGGIFAVDRASLSVREGSITALIGPNGAGKTTFFNVITGFYRPDGGWASFQGSRILGRPPHVIARLGMVRTFQITKALSRMPVIDPASTAKSTSSTAHNPPNAFRRRFASKSIRRFSLGLRA